MAASRRPEMAAGRNKRGVLAVETRAARGGDGERVTAHVDATRCDPGSSFLGSSRPVTTTRSSLRRLAAVALAVCIACGTPGSRGRELRARRREAGGASVSARLRAGCTPIETHRIQRARHIPIGSTYRHFDSWPPTSGPHWPTTADPGFYRVELPPEELVHNLEHGQIVVWYAPYIDPEIQRALERLVANAPAAIVAVPSERVVRPFQFVLTAWGASQSCAHASTAVLDHFRRTFQGMGPEDVGVPTFP
jgi:hypothetical protein